MASTTDAVLSAAAGLAHPASLVELFVRRHLVDLGYVTRCQLVGVTSCQVCSVNRACGVVSGCLIADILGVGQRHGEQVELDGAGARSGAGVQGGELGVGLFDGLGVGLCALWCSASAR